MSVFDIAWWDERESFFNQRHLYVCKTLSQIKVSNWRRSITYISVCVQVVFFVDPKKAIFISSFGARTLPPKCYVCIYIYMWSLSYYYYTNLVSMYISCSSPSPQKKISHFLLITKNLRFLQLEFFAKVISVFLREIEAGCFSVAFRIYWLFLVIYRAP